MNRTPSEARRSRAQGGSTRSNRRGLDLHRQQVDALRTIAPSWPTEVDEQLWAQHRAPMLKVSVPIARYRSHLLRTCPGGI